MDKKLANSIKEHGLAQKIVARKLENGAIEVIGGQRRLKALESLGLTEEEILGKVDVRENVSDVEAVFMALAENEERKDLLPVEEGRAFATLVGMKVKVEEIAKKTGNSANYIQERMNLLELPNEIQDLMNRGKMALGYAEPLLKLKEYPDGQKQLAHEIQTGYGMNIQRANESVKDVLHEVKKTEHVRKKYGPCPKCESKQIDVAEKYGSDRKLKCAHCGLVFDAVTKDPWEVYQIKEHAEKIGLKAEVVEGKVNMAPKEVAKVIQDRIKAIETVEDPNLGRSTLTPEQMLAFLIKGDNVNSIDVDDGVVKVSLIEHSGLFFRAYRKNYKQTNEKSSIKITEGWGTSKDVAVRKPMVKAFLERVEKETPQ